jgi:hypothetical protein
LGDVAHELKVCGLPAGTIKLPFRILNSILVMLWIGRLGALDFEGLAMAVTFGPVLFSIEDAAAKA